MLPTKWTKMFYTTMEYISDTHEAQWKHLDSAVSVFKKEVDVVEQVE